MTLPTPEVPSPAEVRTHDLVPLLELLCSWPTDLTKLVLGSFEQVDIVADARVRPLEGVVVVEQHPDGAVLQARLLLGFRVEENQIGRPYLAVLAGRQHVQILLLLEIVELESGVVPLGPHGEGDVELLVYLIHAEHGVHHKAEVDTEQLLHRGGADVLQQVPVL